VCFFGGGFFSVVNMCVFDLLKKELD